MQPIVVFSSLLAVLMAAYPWRPWLMGGPKVVDSARCGSPVYVQRGSRPRLLACTHAELDEALAACGLPEGARPQVEAGQSLVLDLSFSPCRVHLAPMPGADRVALGLPADVCEPDEAALVALPGIGPARARKIIAARCRTVDEARIAARMSPAAFEPLRPLLGCSLR
ncbi:MAG: hypothetical protein EXR76_00440 [Myxococcales bacterium]|nr:hypothetical protein [Myxococcales bacterium]